MKRRAITITIIIAAMTLILLLTYLFFMQFARHIFRLEAGICSLLFVGSLFGGVIVFSIPLLCRRNRSCLLIAPLGIAVTWFGLHLFFGVPLTENIILHAAPFLLLCICIGICLILRHRIIGFRRSEILFIALFFAIALPILACRNYMTISQLRIDTHAAKLATIDNPHSMTLLDNGEKFLVTADGNLLLLSGDYSEVELLETRDALGESQHAALAADRHTLYLIPRAYDTVQKLDSRESRPTLQQLRGIPKQTFADFPELKTGTPWPVAFSDYLVVASESGLLLKCPYDDQVECQAVHLRNTKPATNIGRQVMAKLISQGADSVAADKQNKKLFVSLLAEPKGIAVIDTDNMLEEKRLLAGHRVESLLFSEGKLYCSVPLKGAIAVIDANAGNHIRWISNLWGVNAIARDEENQRLFVSNFLHPFVVEIDEQTGKTQRFWRISRRIKHLLYDPNRQAVLATGRDSNAVFSIAANF